MTASDDIIDNNNHAEKIRYLCLWALAIGGVYIEWVAHAKEAFLVPSAYAASTVVLAFQFALSSHPLPVPWEQLSGRSIIPSVRRHIHLKSEVMVSQTPNRYEDFRMQCSDHARHRESWLTCMSSHYRTLITAFDIRSCLPPANTSSMEKDMDLSKTPFNAFQRLSTPLHITP